MLISGFNLAAADYRLIRRQRILAVGIVAGLILLLAGQVALWAGLRRQGRGIGDRLALMEGEIRHHEESVRSARASVPSEAIKQYEAKVLAYNKILEASAFSWMGLLMELERSLPPAVSLSEIQPDLGTGQVVLRGLARSFDDLGLFLHGLEERTAFHDVYLLRQSERKGSAGEQDALEFTVSLNYPGRER